MLDLDPCVKGIHPRFQLQRPSPAAGALYVHFLRRRGRDRDWTGWLAMESTPQRGLDAKKSFRVEDLWCGWVGGL
jgi:hypothetical protein